MKRNALFVLLLAGIALAQSAPSSVPGPVPSCQGKPSDPVGCITPPRMTYSPNPTYDEESRKAKIEGTVRLCIIVTKDGVVKNPRS
jgi:outer membrane biosynthesis protein TonB